MGAASIPLTLEWQEGQLLILDQTKLPHEVVIERQQSIRQVWQSIRELKVRGAPAIGVAAAYGLLVDMNVQEYADVQSLGAELVKRAEYLKTARPTAVNLSWALDRMLAKMQRTVSATALDLFQVLIDEAMQIHQEDRDICKGIGAAGLPLIRTGMSILTHCNAGALAVSGLGTALAPLYLAHEKGIRFHVYADETRPLLQGARLTAWELQQAGIDVSVICDNMAAHVMSQGLVDMVIVGTDRVAANGDVANKIGTLGVAIAASHFDIPFYVACPSSTVDLNTPTGAQIEIEQRDAIEIRELSGQPVTMPDAKVFNPAFDVTPAALVTGIVTEAGILTPGYPDKLRQLFE
jgi:methylthioribose-1-phosphate isomerase